MLHPFDDFTNGGGAILKDGGATFIVRGDIIGNAKAFVMVEEFPDFRVVSLELRRGRLRARHGHSDDRQRDRRHGDRRIGDDRR